MVTSQTAIVPLRSLFIVARWIFKSWTGSAFPLATAGALAADACLIGMPLDLMKKYAPTATTATATAMPIHSPFEPFSLISSGVSNMNSSDSLSPRHFCKRSPIASDEKDKLPPSEIRDCARERFGTFQCRNRHRDNTEGARSPSLRRGFCRSESWALFRGFSPRSRYEGILKSAPELRNSLFSDIFSPHFRVLRHISGKHLHAFAGMGVEHFRAVLT